jgi:hypothetical protein
LPASLVQPMTMIGRRPMAYLIVSVPTIP